MPTKRHQETLAVAGDSAAFAELKRRKPEDGAPSPPEPSETPRGGVTRLDHALDRSEAGDPLQRAVERSNGKRGQGEAAGHAVGQTASRNAPRSSVTKSTASS